MPEYLAPGVYLEETSYRARSIEGVSTSTAGFVGPTRWGPTSGKPEVITSFGEFVRVYGGLEDLAIDPPTNYVAHAARAFFEEGGARLYVSRVLGTGAERARHSDRGVTLTARHPGVAGNARVTFVLGVGPNVLIESGGERVLGRTRNRDSVLVTLPDAGGVNPMRRVCTAIRDASGDWTLAESGGITHELADVAEVFPVTVRVDIALPTVDNRGLTTFGEPLSYGPFSLSPDSTDGLWQALGEDVGAEPPPIVLSSDAAPAITTLTDAIAPFESPLPPDGHWLMVDLDDDGSPVPPVAPRSTTITLDDGSDGDVPGSGAYRGTEDDLSGLAAFAAIEDISIVAAPGSTEYEQAQGIRQQLIVHCDNMRYRVAVLDTPSDSSVGEARAWRNETSSTRAAMYYPWVIVDNPVDGSRLALPPSGFVAGIWARNDINRAVFKAPANEVVRSIIDVERRLTKGQQEVLNPEAVNCIRFFAGRGNLVWGARTMHDDPEWKYISVRRYMCYLERSIERSTQWAVFEPNGDALWANVRQTVEDFLVSEWKSGALLGTDPKQAFFVRCDRSTMTQNDLDNGRLVCLIGVAIVKPAEFVIFRIGQWTATATN